MSIAKWRGLGEFRYMQGLPEGKGRNRLAALLQGTVPELARRSKRFHARTGELPFIYGEKQVHSVLLPSLDSVADVAFLEQPLRRRKASGDEAGGNGWVDYWVDHRDLIALIEVKHSWLAVRTAGAPNTWVTDKWSTCLHQVSTIAARSGARSLVGEEDTVWAVGLMLVAHYRGGERQYPMPCWEDCWSNHLTLVEQLGDVKGAARRPINWHGLWRLHPELAALKYADEPWPRYPALSIIVAAEPV